MVRVNSILTEKVLVSRESAHELEDALMAAVTSAVAGPDPGGSADVIVDFEGVAGVTPSFMDELITIFETIIKPAGRVVINRLIVSNPPTRLSSKFEAVARGHAMSIQMLPDGSWLLEAVGS